MVVQFKDLSVSTKVTGAFSIEAGVRLVGEPGDPLKHVLSRGEQINSQVSEMAQAAAQGATGIEQVNAAGGQMDQMTQQNAAMVEQSTAASRNLAGETRTLQGLVKFFNVGEVDRYVAQQAATRSPPCQAIDAACKGTPTRPGPPSGVRRGSCAQAGAGRPGLDRILTISGENSRWKRQG